MLFTTTSLYQTAAYSTTIVHNCRGLRDKPHVSDAELLFEDVDSLGALFTPSIGRASDPFPPCWWRSLSAKIVAVLRSASFFFSARISSFRRRFALALSRKRTAQRWSDDA